MKQLNNICVYIYICRCGKHPAVQVQADHPGLKVQDDRVTFQVEGFQRQIRVPQEASTLRQAAERLARFVEAKDAEQKNLSLLKRTAAESHMTLFGQKKYYIYIRVVNCWLIGKSSSPIQGQIWWLCAKAVA